MSPYGFRWAFVSSGCCWWLMSNGGAADDGAVETALWREDVSVEAVLVVLEDPLPLKKRIRLALQNGQGQRQVKGGVLKVTHPCMVGCEVKCGGAGRRTTPNAGRGVCFQEKVPRTSTPSRQQQNGRNGQRMGNQHTGFL